MNQRLFEEAEKFIGLRRSTLYGQTFEVVSDDGRKEAAVWLTLQIEAVLQSLSHSLTIEKRVALLDCLKVLGVHDEDPQAQDSGAEEEAWAAAETRAESPITLLSDTPKTEDDWIRLSGW